jgi:hypothetical protein
VIEWLQRRLTGASKQRIALAVASTALAVLYLIANWHAGAYGWSVLFAVLSLVGLAIVAALVTLRGGKRS